MAFDAHKPKKFTIFLEKNAHILLIPPHQCLKIQAQIHFCLVITKSEISNISQTRSVKKFILFIIPSFLCV
jgi:hypothetical protein